LAQTLNDSFTDQFTFKFRKSRLDLKVQLARSGSKIKIVTDADEANSHVD
jgi:hypothetical protein